MKKVWSTEEHPIQEDYPQVVYELLNSSIFV